MRSSSIRRRPGSFRSNGDRNSFWLSFSDLMSALVLVVILVLFYMLYQYFLMYDDYAEKRDAMVILQTTLQSTEEDIAAKEAALIAAQSELNENNAALSSAQTELTAAQEDLAVQQLLVAAAQQAAQLTQQELDRQATELQQTLSTLDEQQQQILLQQAQLLQQQGQLEDQQSQIEQLVGIRTRIIASLSEALKSAHISATVDPTSGAIALESDVLFPTGESELSREGKARIDAFLPVYLNVLFSDEYRGYVSEIIIEGHTDSVGGYIDNLKLSQQRAYNVGSYVLADGYPHISDEMRDHLRKIATANGRSYSNLIYNADGTENRNASRRVVFKFRLTDEQMVARLQALLEQGN